MSVDSFLLPALYELLFQFTCFLNRFTRQEIGELKKLPDLNFGFLALAVRSRRALRPFDGLGFRFDVDDPVAADQFLGLREGPVDYDSFATRKFDASAFRS